MKRLLIVTACLSMVAVSAFGVSLQNAYDQCGPGEGYDKLLILDPGKTYTGGCGVLMNKKSCIRGNGALVDLDGYNLVATQPSTELTVEGCCLINAGYYGAVKVEDYARVTINGNTICKSNGLAAIYVWIGCSATVKNNIIFDNNNYGIAKHQSTLILDVLYNDVFDNPGGNYMYFCPGWGGGSWYSFVPSPGTGEIHADPFFVDYNNNNFYLKSNSPCRGAAEGGKDMGAKSYNPAVEPASLGRVKALYN